MRHTLLLSIFLCTIPTAYGMEIEESVEKNEKIYTLFKENQPTQAEKNKRERIVKNFYAQEAAREQYKNGQPECTCAIS